MRRLTTLTLLVAALAAAGATAARADHQTDARVFVLWIDGTSLEDWSDPELPAFSTLLAEGASAVLVARVAADARDPLAASLAAGETLGAGRLVRGVPHDEPRASPLTYTASAYGLSVSLLSGAPEDAPRAAARAFGAETTIGSDPYARTDRVFPGGTRTDVARVRRALGDAAGQANLVIVHMPEMIQVEQELPDDPAARGGWASLTMQRADQILAVMQERLREQDRVIVVAPTPPMERRRAGTPLSAIAIGGGPAGLLRSESTRRDGLVTITDVAPTILGPFGISPLDVERAVLPRIADQRPLGFTGSPAEISRVTDGLARAGALEASLLAAERGHRAATRLFVVTAALVLLLALLTVLAGRGLVARGRLPRGWRDLLATAMIAVAAFPAASLLAGTSPALAAGFAILAAFAARIALGREGALATILVASAALVAGDILAGGPLGARAALLEPIAHGWRQRPLDPVTVGVLAGGLLGIGALLDRSAPSARAPLAPLVFGAFAVGLAGTHGAGADGGAAAALAPAVLVVAAAVARIPLDRFTTTAIVAASIGALGLVALTYGPALWVEELPLIPQDAIPGVLTARVEAFTASLGSIWLLALAAGAAPAMVLRARRPTLLERGLWGRPWLRVAILASVAAGAIALLTVRSGPATAGTLAILAGIAVLLPLTAADTDRSGP